MVCYKKKKRKKEDFKSVISSRWSCGICVRLLHLLDSEAPKGPSVFTDYHSHYNCQKKELDKCSLLKLRWPDHRNLNLQSHREFCRATSFRRAGRRGSWQPSQNSHPTYAHHRPPNYNTFFYFCGAVNYCWTVDMPIR